MMLVQSRVRQRLLVDLIATVDGVGITITTCAVVQVVQVRLTIVVVVGGQEGRIGVTAHVGGVGQGRKRVSVGARLVLGRELSLLPARVALDMQECRLSGLVLIMMKVLMMTATATGSDEKIVVLVGKVVVSTGFVFVIIVLFIFFVMDVMTDVDRRRSHHLDIHWRQCQRHGSSNAVLLDGPNNCKGDIIGLGGGVDSQTGLLVSLALLLLLEPLGPTLVFKVVVTVILLIFLICIGLTAIS